MKRTISTVFILVLLVTLLYGETQSSGRSRVNDNNAESYYQQFQSREHQEYHHHYDWLDYDYREPWYLARPGIDIKINGVDNDIITQGDSYLITIEFSDGFFAGEIGMWADMNANLIWDPDTDIEVDHYEFSDNDEHDENPAIGHYSITNMGDEEGPHNIGNLTVLFVVQDGGGTDVAVLQIQAVIHDYSVSGQITPQLPYILVSGVGMDGTFQNMVMSNIDGTYQLFLAAPGNYMLMSADAIGVTGGMICTDFYFDFYVDGNLTGYDFSYIMPDVWINGHVADEFGASLAWYEVTSDQFGLHNWTETDENGNYQLGVLEGWVTVGMEQGLIPDYMPPNPVDIYTETGNSYTVDFVIYQADAAITGTIYLDDVLVEGIAVNGWCELGWSWAASGPDGFYTLPVSSQGNELGGYGLGIWDLPPGSYVVEYYEGVLAGTMACDFHIYSVAGGIHGHIYDAVTQQPLPGSWVNCTDGENWYGTGTDEGGYYHLPLPAAVYDIYANADNYQFQLESGVVVGVSMLTVDFYLQPETGITGGDLPPGEVILQENIPNPFNADTRISYYLPESEEVELAIYNVKGQLIEILVSEVQEAGFHDIEWDAGPRVSGIYLYKLTTARESRIRKMILLR